MLAVIARAFPSSERPSIEPLLRQLVASDVAPDARQLTRLAIYDVLRARPEIEAAQRFAQENDILSSRGVPWPTSVFATALECSAPLSWNDASELRRDQDRAISPVDDSVKALPIVDAERPPAVEVTLLLAPEGTTTSVDAAGTAISRQVLDCVTTAAQRFTTRTVTSGYRVYQFLLRPD